MADSDFIRMTCEGGPVVIFEPSPDRMLVCSIVGTGPEGNYAIKLNSGQVSALAAQLNHLINLPPDEVSALIDRIHKHGKA
ncbi:MAG: hypothetical protein O2892_19240 [Actinomycetota bacterium]|nr:hypothetical protein [Actinomycetota bacterium]MDA2951139.1 hypothetical protein [Actinomycetota bacterium]